MAERMPGQGPVEHPLRRTLAGEVHARPYEHLVAPVRATHLAVLHDGMAAADERALVAELLVPQGAEPPGEGATFLSRDLGGLRLRWERHGEFSTFTFFRFDAFTDPFAATALDLVPWDWFERLPGSLMVAVHLAVCPADGDGIDPAREFDGHPVIGSRVLGGAAEAMTAFRLAACGFTRIVVQDRSLTRGQAGRLVQRLLEIETYRMMALLGFPPARHVNAELGRLDGALADIVTALAGPVGGEDRLLLDRLTALAAEAERLDATTGFRLAAARAYHAIVLSRIGELREERFPGQQTVAEFMDRRLAPAMKTCEAAAERQQTLARRVSRAGDLLRTRVDIALEEKNAALLKSMNRRAAVQLRLQETVEGLSVVAISYYLLGLVGYGAKGLKAAGLPIDADVAALLALPLIVGTVWLAVRRLRHALGGGEER
ncbi:MAG: DUF3422 domain-containing protein [Magnetospirillum sp.]|nr:DUF3422 domain-containing protein [Magnetospirillum sp.]